MFVQARLVFYRQLEGVGDDITCLASFGFGAGNDAGRATRPQSFRQLITTLPTFITEGPGVGRGRYIYLRGGVANQDKRAGYGVSVSIGRGEPDRDSCEIGRAHV